MRKLLSEKWGVIILCWFVYTCSYIGKMGYSANIIQIEKTFDVSHATAGIVSTCFFFAYGAGQIINGIFCKKYNVKYVIFFSLLVSGVCNLLMGILQTFVYQKYIWFINGATLSVLWPSLIRYLSERLKKEEMSSAVVAMGTTVAVGTAAVYGLSALFAEFLFYRMIFFVAAVVLPIMAASWFIISAKYLPEKVNQPQLQANDNNKRGVDKTLTVSIAVLAIFAIITNLTKDGLTTWVPSILKEIYSLPDSISILLTLLLPVLAIFGTAVAAKLRKKIPDFIGICITLFGANALLIGAVIMFLSVSAIITLVSFALVSCFMAGINNVITSMAPLYWKDKINSGMLAGILNGFCYVGSTISSYGLGLVADSYGWNVVFWLLCVLCVVCVVIGIVQLLFCYNSAKRGI